jgi:hypothetical protein
VWISIETETWPGVWGVKCSHTSYVRHAGLLKGALEVLLEAQGWGENVPVGLVWEVIEKAVGSRARLRAAAAAVAELTPPGPAEQDGQCGPGPGWVVTALGVPRRAPGGHRGPQRLRVLCAGAVPTGLRRHDISATVSDRWADPPRQALGCPGGPCPAPRATPCTWWIWSTTPTAGPARRC